MKNFLSKGKIALLIVIAIFTTVSIILINKNKHYKNSSNIVKQAEWNDFTGSTFSNSKDLFSLKYPSNWKLGEYRGQTALTMENCTFVLGFGGGGASGWKLLKNFSVTYNNIIGDRLNFVHNTIPTEELIVTHFLNGNYSFALYRSSASEKCLQDYEAILNTLVIH